MSAQATYGALRILEAMQDGRLPTHTGVRLSWGLVEVSLGNVNLVPADIAPSVDVLREMFPGGEDAHEPGGMTAGRTRRSVLDAWQYRVLLEPLRPSGRLYTAELIAHYPREHVEHVWVARGAWGTVAEVTDLHWSCRGCGRRPTARQAAAAALPQLVRP